MNLEVSFTVPNYPKFCQRPLAVAIGRREGALPPTLRTTEVRYMLLSHNSCLIRLKID